MPLLCFILALLLAPLLSGVINRVKARFAGRKGRPYLQLYYDLAKLLRKTAVYSRTTSWVFTTGPMLSLACIVSALLFVPLGGYASLLSFTGDFFLAAYLLAMARFATILAALDTGSAFEGMGASREATYSAMAEPVFLLGLMPLGMAVKSFTLSAMLAPFPFAAWSQHWPILFLLSLSFFLVLLTENCRIPVDDPNTHLELTMIHEVMVLDHGGVELAFIEYGAALKLWFFCAVVSGVIVPDLAGLSSLASLPALASLSPGGGAIVVGDPAFLLFASLLGIFLVAVLVGVTESVMARLRLVRVPQLLALAAVLSALACLLSLL